MGNLKFDVEGKNDTFKNDLSDKISNIRVYRDRSSDGEDEDGKPQPIIDVMTENSVDADELFDFIKKKMDNIPMLTGEVHWHDCTHDEDNPKPCKPQGKYRK